MLDTVSTEDTKSARNQGMILGGSNVAIAQTASVASSKLSFQQITQTVGRISIHDFEPNSAGSILPRARYHLPVPSL